MKVKYGKRKRMEILLDSLRESVAFRRSMAQLFEDIGFDYDLIKNDPAFDAGLRIARMYIKDERLLNWWLYESGDAEEYIDEIGQEWYFADSADLIEYYKMYEF